MSASTPQAANGKPEGAGECQHEHEWYRSGTRTQIIWHDVPKTSVIMRLQFVEYDVYHCTGCNETCEARTVPKYINTIV